MLRYLNFRTRGRTAESPVCRRANWEFLALFSGRCVLVRDEGETVLREPTLAVFPPRSAHGWRGGSERWAAATFHFQPVPPAFAGWMADRDQVLVPLGAAEVERIAVVAEECRGHFVNRVLSSPVVFQKALCTLCQVAMEETSGSPVVPLDRRADAKVEDAVCWFESRLRENPTIEAVAAAVNMSGSNLRRMFRAVRGKSPKQVFTEIRLHRALEAMANSSATLDAVAAETGFADANELCRCFRRCGMESPSRWRRHILSADNDAEVLARASRRGEP